MSKSLRTVEREGENWVRTGGLIGDRLLVPQGLQDLESVVEELAQGLGDMVQPALDWLHLGKAIIDVWEQPVVPVGKKKSRGLRPAIWVPVHEEPGFVWKWDREEDLKGYLERVGIDLSQLFPERGAEDGLSLLGLPEDYRGWHRIEVGLRNLSVKAAPGVFGGDKVKGKKALKRERDKWIYEQCINMDRTWEELAKAAEEHNSEWPPLTTKQGAQLAAKQYADRHNLTPPPPRRNLEVSSVNSTAIDLTSSTPHISPGSLGRVP
jgi:hypothetical protein